VNCNSYAKHLNFWSSTEQFPVQCLPYNTTYPSECRGQFLTLTHPQSKVGHTTSLVPSLAQTLKLKHQEHDHDLQM